MSRPYSRDLRERIVEAMKDPKETYESVCARFSVGRATVNRVWRLYRETGDVMPPVLRGKPPRALSDADRQILLEIHQDRPDATLDAITDDLVHILGRSVSRATVGRELRRMGITRKKRRSSPRSGTSSGSSSSEPITQTG